MLQAQKQEQEIIDREKMRKERPTETLVKNAFSGGAIETEAVEHYTHRPPFSLFQLQYTDTLLNHCHQYIVNPLDS
jgi:hypothetical protein